MTTIAVIGSFMLVPYIGTEFMPKTDSREFTMKQLPEGIVLSRTEATEKPSNPF